MRGVLRALAVAGALFAVAIAPIGWISLTAPVQLQSRVERIVPDFTVAVWHPPSVKAYDANWWIGKTMVTGEGWHEPAPLAVLPRPRPAKTVMLLAEAQGSVNFSAKQLGVRLDLWCMAAINKWLQHIGVRGTGSDLAVSVKHWGKPSKPVPGAIALKPRRGGSGHVVIVKAVKGKTLIAISPNHRGKVREAKYPLRVFYAFRAPA